MVVSGEALLRKLLAPVCGPMVVSGEALLRKLLAPVNVLMGNLTVLGEVPSDEGSITL